MEPIEPPRDPLPIHIAVANDIADLHGYDQVIIYARKAGTPGREWVTTWGRGPEDKQAAARIGAVLREGVVEPLEKLRGLLGEVVYLSRALLTKHRALHARITAALGPIALHTDSDIKKAEPR